MGISITGNNFIYRKNVSLQLEAAQADISTYELNRDIFLSQILIYDTCTA